MSTYIIAEPGSTHDRNFDRALDLVKIAADAGADACKFQYWSSADRLAKRRNALFYRHIYQDYQMPKGWLEALAIECAIQKIDFMCTTYLPEDIASVAPFVDTFKVASFEAGDTAFIMDHLEYHKEIIVSAGMMSSEELESLVRLRAAIGNMYILHCVSSYPAPLESLNLGVIRQYGLDGFSDHSRNVSVGALAVAAGAKIVEVHYRYPNTESYNPDYSSAHSPKGLSDYIKNIRDAEMAMGDGVKKMDEVEEDMAVYRVQNG